ncbi:hypothetical protein T440DRAFT_91943 [Plenodomus tracheiphilus IPT5]|uniref:MYND-type zinc finger protein samB n=1 Tax=Plenodomus tracheiphilus IPT5 TaxID=1408161 RepID=A0A6A7B874_9PLEO|nr:hypothetical protein T440DRAFT_91943 [Plenodomus tracheiphilus IPT5]
MQLCRFSVCARTFETGRGAACPSCFDVPVEDLYSSRTDYEYCCQTCLDKDADAHKAHCGRRQVWRDVTRAGAVGEAIFGSWRESMFFMDITSASSNAHEWDLDLIVTHPYPGIPTFTNPRLSDEEYKAATSYESCTRATILLTNPLAWLLKGTLTQVELP